MYVEDGEPVFYNESTGSIAGTDEYLIFVWLLVPSALIRLARPGARPAILEIGWFLFAFWIVYIGFSSVGGATFAKTFEATKDVWIALELVATAIAAITFCGLAVEGWLLRRRA